MEIKKEESRIDLDDKKLAEIVNQKKRYNYSNNYCFNFDNYFNNCFDSSFYQKRKIWK